MRYDEEPTEPVESSESARKPTQDHDWFVYLRWTEQQMGYPYEFAEPRAFDTKMEAIEQARAWTAAWPNRSIDGPHKVYRSRNHG